MTEMEAKEIQEMLEAAKPSVIESLKKQLADSVSYEVKSETCTLIREHVQTWVKENVLPEVTKAMIESKEGMISTGVALAPAMVDEIVKAMTLSISENMKTSWDRKKLFDALLG